MCYIFHGCSSSSTQYIHFKCLAYERKTYKFNFYKKKHFFMTTENEDFNLDDFSLDDFKLDTPEGVNLDECDIFIPASIQETMQAINIQAFFILAGQLETFEENGLYYIREKDTEYEEVLLLEDTLSNYFYFEKGNLQDEKGQIRCEFRLFPDYHEGHVLIYSVTLQKEGEYSRYFSSFGYQSTNQFIHELPESVFVKNFGAYTFYNQMFAFLDKEKCNMIMPHVEFIRGENRNFKLYHRATEKFFDYLGENDDSTEISFLETKRMSEYCTNGYFLATYNIKTMRYDYNYIKI